VIEGLLAALWCAALWFGGDLVGAAKTGADRVRNAIVLGIAIPGALGLFHALYPGTLWLCAVACVALRFVRHVKPVAHDYGLYATIAALSCIVWPPLSRPLLDGDSLLYHYPNAVAWLQDHTIWTSRAPYWFYPGGSELLAAGFAGAAGRFALPLVGAAALILLSSRIYEHARSAGANTLTAIAPALAFACTPLVAFQGGGLQNDLLLAAFFVEVIVTANAGALAILTLIKPFGVFEAGIAAVLARIPWRTSAIAAIPFVVWNARTILLLRAGGALESTPPYWSSTIAGNLGVAVPELFNALVHTNPSCFVWLAFVALGFARSETRRYAWAGLATTVVYAFLPFAYRAGSTDYLADGSSLRFLLPAFACGALVASAWVARFSNVALAGFGIMTTLGLVTYLGIYWNDADTRAALPIAVVMLLAVLFASRTRVAVVATAFAIVTIVAVSTAQARYLGFYDDGMKTHAFTWLAQSSPGQIVASNIRIGMIEMTAPGAVVISASPADGCATARARHALWFAGSNEGADLGSLFTRARVCGRVLYSDDAAVVVDPEQR